MITLVTIFYDIGRKDWGNFTRSVEEYLTAFTFFLHYDYKMIVFIDDRYHDKFIDYCGGRLHENIKVIRINRDWLNNNIWAWSKYKKEKEIMGSETYRKIIPERIALNYPENTRPEYTILTHSKIDLVNYVIDNNLTEDEYVGFVDFGYFHDKTDQRYVPRDTLDINKFDLDRVNVCAVNPINKQDKNITWTLINAPEKLAAYFFLGNRENLKKFQELAHKWLEIFQNKNIADDEQHLWLQCYFENPELFRVWAFGYWHQALRHFSK
jgi:protein YibB